MGLGALQLIKLSLFYLGLCCFLEESPIARPEIHGGRWCLVMTAGRYRGSTYYLPLSPSHEICVVWLPSFHSSWNTKVQYSLWPHRWSPSPSHLDGGRGAFIQLRMHWALLVPWHCIHFQTFVNGVTSPAVLLHPFHNISIPGPVSQPDLPLGVKSSTPGNLNSL